MIKQKLKVLLLEISLMNFILWISQGDQKEGECGVTRSIIDEFHYSCIQRDPVQCECGVTLSIIGELHCSDFQGDQMEGESRVTRSIIDELHSLDIHEIMWNVKMV